MTPAKVQQLLAFAETEVARRAVPWLDIPGTVWREGRRVEGYALRGALFSPDLVYRYAYVRTWDPRASLLIVVALNPSTADENDPDPTATRLETRARKLGHGGLVIVNLFAYRSRDPAALYTVADPVGPANNDVLERLAASGFVLAAWGAHGGHRDRNVVVRDLVLAGVDVYALSLTKEGHPGHPLYLPYALTPFLWRPRGR